MTCVWVDLLPVAPGSRGFGARRLGFNLDRATLPSLVTLDRTFSSLKPHSLICQMRVVMKIGKIAATYQAMWHRVCLKFFIPRTSRTLTAMRVVCPPRSEDQGCTSLRLPTNAGTALTRASL